LPHEPRHRCSRARAKWRPGVAREEQNAQKESTVNEDNIEVSEDFNFVNHNETDFSSFRRFRSNLDARYSAAEKERTKNYRVANYRVWRERMPLSLRKFNIRSFSQKVSDDIRRALKERKFRSFFLTGESRTGKTCLAYNLAGVLILRGL